MASTRQSKEMRFQSMVTKTKKLDLNISHFGALFSVYTTIQ